MEFFHWRGIQYIASSIGKPLRIDARSFSRGSVGSARVQIEFDASLELRQAVKLIDAEGTVVEVGIEYEFKPPHCRSCGTFGHGVDRCPRNPDATRRARPVVRRDRRVHTGTKGVEESRARQNVSPPGLQEDTVRSENVFQALADEDVIEGIDDIRADIAGVVEVDPGITLVDAALDGAHEALMDTGLGEMGDSSTRLHDREVEEDELMGDGVQIMEDMLPKSKGRRPTESVSHEESSESLGSCAVAKEASLGSFSDMVAGLQSSGGEDFSPSPKKKKKGKSGKKSRAKVASHVTVRRPDGASN